MIFRMGGDPDAMDRVAARLEGYAGGCRDISSAGSAASERLHRCWAGTDAQRWATLWHTGESSLARTETELRSLAGRLRSNAAAQRLASDAALSRTMAPWPVRPSCPDPRSVTLGSRALDRLVAAGVLPVQAQGMNARDLGLFLRGRPDLARALMARVDVAGAPAVLELLRDGDVDGTGAGTGAGEPLDGPERIAAWFNALPPEDRRLVATLYPAMVGNLSGAPFDARSAANQIAVAVALDDTRRDIEAARGRIVELRAADLAAAQSADDGTTYRTGAVSAEEERIADLEGRARLYTDVLERAGSVDERQIVLFDPAHGRFAEVDGGLGRQTRDVAVIVPGVASRLGTISDNVRTYATFADRSGGGLAVITLLPGEVPGSVITAVNGSTEQANAPVVAQFSHDVRREVALSTSPADPAKVTFAGHSLGGAIVGLAERQGLDADRVVHIESAGMGHGITSPADLPGEWAGRQRYAMTAPDDPIRIGRGTSVGSLGHGANPDSFPGVVSLTTGRYADGGQIWGLPAHSGVFDVGSDSWENLYQVFTGGTVRVVPSGWPDGWGAGTRGEEVDIP